MRIINLMYYVGSKCHMMKHLQPIFDELPHRCFVDVFGGAATVTLNKKPSPVEVLNDINGNLHTLYRVLRDPIQSEKLYEYLNCTLYSRDEWKYARDILRGSLQVDDVERARCTFMFYTASFAGDGTSYGYSKSAAGPLNAMQSKVQKLPAFHERLKKVQIEHSDFSELFRRYDSPTTLFYLDPPYHSSTRVNNIYSNEMSDDDHERLLRCILDCEGSCVLSGYDNAMYNDVLNGLEKKIFASQTIVRQKDYGRQNRTECVWIKRAKRI
jgi:DNA adenine methylase